jgi:hypothetical protein
VPPPPPPPVVVACWSWLKRAARNPHLQRRKMKLFAHRHSRLQDDDDNSSGGDSSHSLLPRSAKNAWGAFAAHMGMICSLVSDSPF